MKIMDNLNNKNLKFRVMVTSIEVFETEIENYNNFFKTDFKIINVIDDEVPFCDVEVSKYTMADIFGLGFCLARYEEKLRKEGRIDW